MTDTTRKLATIVALDVTGYSARTEADEARTTAEVAALRKVIEAMGTRASSPLFFNASSALQGQAGCLRSQEDGTPPESMLFALGSRPW